MRPKIYLLPAIILSLALVSFSARADVVVLKTGKKFEVEKVWREEDKIWIVFHGMKASIPQSKIERIDNESKNEPEKLVYQKEAKLDIKKTTTSPLRQTSRRPIRQAMQSTPMPPHTEIKKDQRRIFPGGGLNDLQWGTKITEIRGLEKIRDAAEQEGVAEYRQKKEGLAFGKAELSSINYAFWRDRLYMLTILTKGHSNYVALRDEVFRQYGRGHRINPTHERYLWTDGSNDMMLRYSADGQQGLLWLRSSELDRQYKLSQMKSGAAYLKWIKSRN